MDQKTLYLELNQSFNRLFRLLSAIAPSAYNSSSVGDGWSAGQLADHLILSARGLLELVNGPAEQRTGPIDEKIPVIRKFMLDYSKKYKSPDNVVPANGPFDPGKQIGDLNQLQLGWLEAARSLNPAETCLLFPLPAVGFLTRQEAGYFIHYHFQRHLHQMERKD